MTTGVESIRIKGQRIEDLPLGLGNEAKAQLPEAIEAERLAAIETVCANYPTHRIDYLVSRVKECDENKDRMRKTIGELNKMSSEYTGQISMCKHRDKMIVDLDGDCKSGKITGDEFKAERKDLLKRYPPYSIPAMEQQIVQNNEGIERCNQVIEAEDASIKEFTEVATLCRVRDKELKLLGAQAEGS
jgi:hypothetical protein